MLREEVGILVVDDVAAMRTQISDLLKSFGFRKIRTATSGEEAKAFLQLVETHLILRDWQMQTMNGLEFLKYVRAHPNFGKVPFIMVTAESTKERVIEAIKSGVDDYLVK